MNTTKKDEALKLALEALEKAVATCFDRYSHEHVMSRPEHFVNQAITAIREALALDTVPLAEQPAQQSAERGEPVVALQRVMARLADLLDEDQFAEIEGMVTGAGVTPPPRQPPTDEQKDAARWRWLSWHIKVAWDEGKFTSLVRIVSDKDREALNASIDRMMAGDWSDAEAAHGIKGDA